MTLSLLTSCGSEQQQQESSIAQTEQREGDEAAWVIIDRSIENAGGIENWRKRKNISFDKTSTTLDSVGKVTRELHQHFDYMMHPEFRARVQWHEKDTSFTIIHNGQQAVKLINGQTSEEQRDIDHAWNSSYGSHYVMGMPFKLADPGVVPYYEGTTMLYDSVPADVIRVTYKPGAGSAAEYHTWYYYFEPETGKLLANALKDKKGYTGFTQYASFSKANGLTLPAERYGYIVDAGGKPVRKVSVSVQKNIAFDKELTEDKFQIPSDGKQASR